MSAEGPPQGANSAPSGGSEAASAASVGAVLIIEGAAKTYPNGTRALEPVDLALAAGEFVALLGPSGCGKSTLLRMAAGLLAPSTGRIRWWGADELPADDPQRKLAMVFQTPTLMPWARVATNVRLPLDLAHVERKRADAIARDALAGVGLGDFARAFPRELSGGMQMRVSIARALAVAPALLLMDEPFGALDEFTRHKLDDELAALWRARALTVLFVTHSIQEAVYLATRVVVMTARPGRVVADVAIAGPQPRTPAFRASGDFVQMCTQVSASVVEASSIASA